MKAHWRTIVAVLIGSSLGGIGGFSLAAPSASAYVVTEIDQITDAGAYETMKSKSMQAVVEAQMADGRYLARTDDITALDGTPPKAFVVVAFKSETQAKEYYESAKESTAMRMKASKSRSFLVRICSDGGKLSSDC